MQLPTMKSGNCLPDMTPPTKAKLPAAMDPKRGFESYYVEDKCQFLQRDHMMFLALDVDQDGAIGPDELDPVTFAIVDRNGDGRIDRAEYQAARRWNDGNRMHFVAPEVDVKKALQHLAGWLTGR